MLAYIVNPLKRFAIRVVGVCRDLFPITLVILVFQLVVLRQPFPEMANVIAGLILVISVLALFVVGLEIGLFPVGEAMAEAFARKGSLFWLLLFGFGLGFSTTIAEPALIAVSYKAQEVSGGALNQWGLRLAVASGVAIGIGIGTFRIVTGTPLYLYIIAGYVIVVIQTAFAPRDIIALAYDSGDVTTSTVTVGDLGRFEYFPEHGGATWILKLWIDGVPHEIEKGCQGGITASLGCLFGPLGDVV